MEEQSSTHSQKSMQLDSHYLSRTSIDIPGPHCTSSTAALSMHPLPTTHYPLTRVVTCA